MIRIQEIDIPLDCSLIHNEFYNYDPLHSFNASDSLKYLHEDLLQCSFPEEDMLIDVGWYGDIVSNKGEFRIYIIKGENWDIPLNIIYPKSAEETKILLNKILQYYTKTDIKEDPNDD